MAIVTWIGLAASICTGISLLPQLIKIIQEKKPSDISYPMLMILLLGLGLWIWYGIKKDDWIIIVSNTVSFIINIAILVLNNTYKNS